jgi:hypothetical protein
MPNKSSPHGGFISEGTISHGTLRTEDLLARFADEYERVLPFSGFSLAYDARNITSDEEASEVLTELFDALDAIASREGMYFGAHPGDGSDFGYWRTEDEED